MYILQFDVLLATFLLLIHPYLIHPYTPGSFFFDLDPATLF